MREFKDRLRPLGPGRIGLSLDNDSGLATLVLDNHERRNGEKERVLLFLLLLSSFNPTYPWLRQRVGYQHDRALATCHLPLATHV